MVRKAKEKDLSSLKILIDFASRKGFILPRSKREIKENLNSFFVALENGKIVGCCALDIYNWKLAEIRSLVVLPAFQKKGLGRKLVEKCLVKAKKLKIYEVLSITREDRFFSRLGFRKCLNKQWPMFLKTGSI